MSMASNTIELMIGGHVTFAHLVHSSTSGYSAYALTGVCITSGHATEAECIAELRRMERETPRPKRAEEDEPDRF
jgi:hypothetical protein